MLKDTHIVEKSKSLVWGQFQDYGLGELKILDTYLSRINARDPNSSLVAFTKKEYAELMGLDPNIRTAQLKRYTKKLLGSVVTVDLPEEGYVQYPLFSKAECGFDKNIGQVVIKIKCHDELKPAFFEIVESRYIKYQLKNVISLSSHFSVRLYNMLKAMPYGWTVKVSNLRDQLGATAKTYDDFRRFNAMVLKKAISEINDKTDLNVTMDCIRVGRSVDSIRFAVEEKKQVTIPASSVMDADEEELTQTHMDGFGYAEEDLPDPDDQLGMAKCVLPREFTDKQVQLLWDMAVEHVPQSVSGIADQALWICDYLRRKALLMASTPNVKDKYAWLRKAVAEDWV